MGFVLGLALLTGGLATADPAPPAELSAADTAKLIGFFDKLIPAMLVQKDNCAKMATVVDGAVTANAAMLRGVMKQLAAGKVVPKAEEEKLSARMEKDAKSLERCAGDRAVETAMKRIADPDLPPATTRELESTVINP